MQIRLKGLVKFSNYVKQQLRQGIPTDQQLAFTTEVNRVISQVEEICQSHQTTPDSLFGASRKAYYFLKHLDLSQLPQTIEHDTSALQIRSIRLRNIRKLTDYFADKLWENSGELLDSSSAFQAVEMEISEEAARIENLCKRNDALPAALSDTARYLYCWLKFLSSNGNLQGHLSALALARQILDDHDAFELPVPVVIHMINQQSIYRSRLYSDRLLIKCSEGYMNADAENWLDMFRNILDRSSGNDKKTIRAFALTEDFSAIVFELESFAEADAGHARGAVYDLNESFSRVNQQYFSGEMVRPRLRWSGVITLRKMGHYQATRDTVMIASTLDHADVPEWVIDFVMYHELLHKKHGAKLVNGRRFVHTTAFRNDEQLFEKFTEANEFISHWVSRIRK